MYTSEALRKTIARKPSHLGSNRNSPLGGRSSASLASIGSIGGAMGNSESDLVVIVKRPVRGNEVWKFRYLEVAPRLHSLQSPDALRLQGSYEFTRQPRWCGSVHSA